MILVIQLSFIYSLTCYYYTHWLYARSPFLFSYTLIRSLSDDPEFACSDWMFYSIDQAFVEIVRFARTKIFFLFDSGILASSLFILFLGSLYIIINCHFISLFIYYYVWTSICSSIAVIIDLLKHIFVAYSGYLRLIAYTWGIFLAYKRRRLSSRLRSSVFWEVGSETLYTDLARFRY